MTRLGDYELLRRIGKGGMAEVWMGRRAGLAGAAKAVAVKILDAELATDAKYREMFLREVRLSMLLSHSNVVQVFDVARTGACLYMAMEWVDGLNLAEISVHLRQTRRRLSPAVSAYVVGEVLRGLTYAHTLTHRGRQHCVVHRDVSPQNVLVSVSGEVKLADFGIARLAREDTRGTVVKGKLRYMAPEQLAGSSSGLTVDLYAVGALFHELLEGQTFRGALNDAQLFDEVARGVVPLLTHEVPADLDAFRLAMLERDPQRRVQSADAALRQLSTCFGFKDTSRELAGTVRGLMGVAAPRSGFAAVTDLPPPERRKPRDRAGPSPSQPGAVGMGSSEVTQTAATLHRPRPASARDVPSAKPDRRLGPALLALVGSLLILVAAAWGLLARPAQPVRSDPPQSPVAGRERDEAGQTAVAAMGPRIRISGVVAPANIDRDAPGSAPRDPGHAGGGARGPVGARAAAASEEKMVARKPHPRRRATAGRDAGTPAVRVTFKTGDYRFVYVKIGPHILALEPVRTLELPVGRHPLFMRERTDDPWVPVSEVRIRPGREYEVRLRRPPGIDVKSRLLNH
ncbi:MAG: protein kinase [Nannocystaceae bacterium]